MSIIFASGNVFSRLDELMSTYNTIHDMLAVSPASSSGVSCWNKENRQTVMSLYHHRTARFSRNHQILMRKCAEFRSLILYYMGDIKEMNQKILLTLDIKTPKSQHNALHTTDDFIYDNNNINKSTTLWIDIERNKYRNWLSAGTHFVAVATEERSELQGKHARP